MEELLKRVTSLEMKVSQLAKWVHFQPENPQDIVGTSPASSPNCNKANSDEISTISVEYHSDEVMLPPSCDEMEEDVPPTVNLDDDVRDDTSDSNYSCTPHDLNPQIFVGQNNHQAQCPPKSGPSPAINSEIKSLTRLNKTGGIVRTKTHTPLAKVTASTSRSTPAPKLPSAPPSEGDSCLNSSLSIPLGDKLNMLGHEGQDFLPEASTSDVSAPALEIKHCDCHRSICPDMRNGVVRKILQAIHPSSSHITFAIGVHRFVAYAKMVESDAYEFARSKSEYYRHVADKLYNIQKRLSRMRTEFQASRANEPPASQEISSSNSTTIDTL